jgi:DNA-binding SARP family transcriptional activator
MASIKKILAGTGNSPMNQICLLGTFAFDPAPSGSIGFGKGARHLSSYLFSFPNAWHRREKIMDLIWRDLEPRQARKSLSTALWQSRNLLPSNRKAVPVLTANTQFVRLDLENTDMVDAHRFQTAVANASSIQPLAERLTALDRAVRIYTAPFLEECDQDWALHKREELQSLHLRALTQLMDGMGHQRRYDEALDYGRRILASDPTRERIQRAVMLLYVANGQRAEAIRQFSRCRAALKSECNVEPMPQTAHLLKLIQSGEVFQQMDALWEKERIAPRDGTH